MKRLLNLCFRVLVDFWTFCFEDYQELDGYWCGDCADVHLRGSVCPRLLKVWCQDCLRFRISCRFGNCSVCGSKSVIRQQARAKQHVLKIVPPTH
jgi:hypothetical protein